MDWFWRADDAQADCSSRRRLERQRSAGTNPKAQSRDRGSSTKPAQLSAVTQQNPPLGSDPRGEDPPRSSTGCTPLQMRASPNHHHVERWQHAEERRPVKTAEMLAEKVLPELRS